jgi:hypothetical protein
MRRRIVGILAVALCLVAVASERGPAFERYLAMRESLQYLPPNMRFYELDRLGLPPRGPAPMQTGSFGDTILNSLDLKASGPRLEPWRE